MLGSGQYFRMVENRSIRAVDWRSLHEGIGNGPITQKIGRI